MNQDFISLFKKNTEYLEKREPLTKRLKLLQETRKIMEKQFEQAEEGIMKEISDIPRPACNHDIYLNVKLNDSYMDEVYACIGCECFLMLPESSNSKIIEVKGEMAIEELKTLLYCLRSIINSKLEYEPNMPIESIITIIEEYLGQKKGEPRKGSAL